MPLQSTAPYTPPKTRNWPMIILITIAAIILISLVTYALISYSGKRGGNIRDNNQGIAVGEPNPNSYDCFSDVYNCGNFSTQAEAQYVFDYCKSLGSGDVHQLDNDGDGRVCEGMG